GAAIEPSIATHDTDIAADNRAQRVIALVKPLQVAECLAVLAPFGRGVTVRFVEPCFAFGKTVNEQFREWFERGVSIEICGCWASVFAASPCGGNSEHKAHNTIATIGLALALTVRSNF